MLPNSNADASNWTVRLGRMLYWLGTALALFSVLFGTALTLVSYRSYTASKNAAVAWDAAHKSDKIYTVEIEHGRRLEIQAPPKTSDKQISEAIAEQKSNYVSDDYDKIGIPIITVGGERPEISYIEFSFLLFGLLGGNLLYFLGRGLRYLVGNE